ncbi:MAG: hypothetical protein ACRC35_13095 [Angustibacter sp.]
MTNSSMTNETTPRVIGIGVLLAVLALTGCGGDDSDAGNQVASVAGGGQTSSSATAQSNADKEKEAVAYVECLRKQGIDLPDPTVDPDGTLQLQPPRGGIGSIDQSTFAKAQESCGPIPEGLTGGFDPSDSQFQDNAVKFADCMRKEGVDVGDPDFSGGAAGNPQQIFPGLDLQDPQQQEAASKCRSAFGDALPGGR